MSKCDIVIPVWNQKDDTGECVESIEKNTNYPHRIIVVDNASDSETKTYLESLKSDKFIVIRNEENLGFIKAVNQGISKSEGNFVCILNNDTIVNTGWLGELVKIAEKNPTVGIVNPSSNTFGQPRHEGLSPSLERKESGRFVQLGGGFGFCMLIKREVIKKIGLFDEAYGMGYFEDTDFSLRAKEVGYKSVRAIAAYVYHKEKTSFKLLKTFKPDFIKNKELFEKKWGRTKRVSVVFGKVDENIAFLEKIAKDYAKEKSWVYVISPKFDTLRFFERYSNLTFYNFKFLFYPLAFLKLLFKKKNMDIIFCDNSIFLKLIKLLRKSDTKLIGEDIS